MTVKVVTLSVGGVGPLLAAGVEEYEKRARRYWRTEIVQVKAGCKGRATPRRVTEAEAERLLRRIPDAFECLALTRTGAQLSSAALARLLSDAALRSLSGVIFVIGGAYGLAPSVLARADRRISLSALTVPHELARLVLAEQLYRAGTIVRKEPYHKAVPT